MVTFWIPSICFGIVHHHLGMVPCGSLMYCTDTTGRTVDGYEVRDADMDITRELLEVLGVTYRVQQ